MGLIDRIAERVADRLVEKAPRGLPAGSTVTEVNQETAKRLTEGVATDGSAALPRDPTLAGVPFPPGLPIAPQPINTRRALDGRATPRRYEYPVSWNLPGVGQPLVPWRLLRQFADQVDVVRRCIEIRKAEICQLDWDIAVSDEAVAALAAEATDLDASLDDEQDPSAGRDDEDEGDEVRKAPFPTGKKKPPPPAADEEKEERAGDSFRNGRSNNLLGRAKAKQKLMDDMRDDIQRIKDFWKKPDKINGLLFAEWLMILLEEHFVLDALAIYPHATLGGDLHSLEILDGSTVKPLLDERGAFPQPPQPAYQQILYGFPRGEFTLAQSVDEAGDFTMDELIYRPRYRRTWTPYGYSNVEQALIMGDLYLKRQQWIRAEYTEGSLPETFMKTDGNWTPEQLKAYEDIINNELSGQSEERHKIKLLPKGFEPEAIAAFAERYSATYDEFLIKLLCSMFDVLPIELGFEPSSGLGGAGFSEHQEATTYRRAIRPMCRWIVDLLNEISYRYLGMPKELTFTFSGFELDDEKTAAETRDIEIKSGTRTLNESRSELGLPPYDFPEADVPFIMTGSGPVFLPGMLEREAMKLEASITASTMIANGEMKPPPGPGGTSPPPGQERPPAQGAPPAEKSAHAAAECATCHLFTGKRCMILGPDFPVAGDDWCALYVEGAPQTEKAGTEVAAVTPEAAQFERGADPQAVAEVEKFIAFTTKRIGGEWRDFDFKFVAADVAAELNTFGKAGRIDLIRKAAGDAPPKVQARRDRAGEWWTTQDALVAAFTPRIAQASAGLLDVEGLVAELDRRGYITKAAPSDEELGYLLGAYYDDAAAADSIRVMQNLYKEAYVGGVLVARDILGIESSLRHANLLTASWLFSSDRNRGLTRMLADAEITIKSIARTRLRDLGKMLAEGLAEGARVSHKTMAKQIRDMLKNPERAEMIARTETNRAMTHASLEEYAENEVAAKAFVTSWYDVCEFCVENEKQDPIPLANEFANGDPPVHPNCRCSVIPISQDEYESRRLQKTPKRKRWPTDEQGNPLPLGGGAQVSKELQDALAALNAYRFPGQLYESDLAQQKAERHLQKWQNNFFNKHVAGSDELNSLVDTVSSWQSMGWETIRDDFRMLIQTGQGSDEMVHLLRLIRAAKPVDDMIWRGAGADFTPGDAFKVGERMNMPLSSFTTDHKVAMEFASNSEQAFQVVYRIEGGFQGVNIQGLSPGYGLAVEKEFVGGGQFEIIDVIDRGFSLFEVVLKQVGVW